MPCRDYQADDEARNIRTQNDRLARIACKAMQELEDQGVADFLLLRDNEVREWWHQHKKDDERAMKNGN